MLLYAAQVVAIAEVVLTYSPITLPMHGKARRIIALNQAGMGESETIPDNPGESWKDPQ